MRTMSRFLLCTTSILALGFTVPVFAETPFALSNETTVVKSGKLDTKDFVHKASVGGMFEVESSKLALEKSSNDQVKKFAQMMIDDHGKANEKLASIMSDKKEGDWVADDLDDMHQAKLDALKSSDNFDADYLKDMKKGHIKTIAMFKDYAANGDDADVKAFASKTLPTLKKHKHHLEMIKSS